MEPPGNEVQVGDYLINKVLPIHPEMTEHPGGMFALRYPVEPP